MQSIGMFWQWEVPGKIVILDNEYLGMVRQWQQLFFDNRYSSVSLRNPDFVKIAEGFGIKAKKTTHTTNGNFFKDKSLSNRYVQQINNRSYRRSIDIHHKLP